MDFCGIEKLSLLDYDKVISCTLFMAGCPFRCPFCHNSELVINPQDAQTIPWSEIKDYLIKRKGVLDGVCITGGEPTLMPDLVDKIKEMRDLGYMIKLDTNGSRPEIIRQLLDQHLVDYIAMDIKNSLQNYNKTIGLKDFDLEKIKASIDLLMHSGIKYEFRTTIIEEFHSEQDIRDISQLIKGCRKYRLQKYVDREGCIEHGFHQVKKDIAEGYVQILKETIENVALRGY